MRGLILLLSGCSCRMRLQSCRALAERPQREVLWTLVLTFIKETVSAWCNCGEESLKKIHRNLSTVNDGKRLAALIHTILFRMVWDGLAPYCTRRFHGLWGPMWGEDTAHLLLRSPCLKSVNDYQLQNKASDILGDSESRSFIKEKEEHLQFSTLNLMHSSFQKTLLSL